MSRIAESVSAVNGLLRTLLATAVAGGVGVAGWFGYQTINERQLAKIALEETRGQLERVQKDLGAAHEEIREKDQQIDQLDTSLRLLKVTHRVARLSVVDQERDPDLGKLRTQLEFVELDDQGNAIDEPKRFSILGDVVYLDSWVVKFDDEYVEKADLDRSTSLVLFRRAFGEHQEPSDGFPLDHAGAAPRVYARGAAVSSLEKRIWDDFWSVANDELRQQELGIRAAHGEAPSMRVENGKSYRIELRASDGLSITPEDRLPPRPPRTSG